MKLSIIIPVYQVEKTLERCVKSILSQKFRDFQVILVDDGSTDGSATLCDDLALQDRRIVVIHQANGGLSDARNKGLKKAKGEYVTFVDSDDYIGEDTLKPLMDLLAIHHDYDILEYSVYEHYGWPKHMNVLRLENREYTDMRAYWYGQKAYHHTYACNKIFRRELFYENKFPSGRNFEDAYMLPELLKHCKTLATTSIGYYYYCYNPEGITAQANGKDMSDLLAAHVQVLRDTEGLLAPPDMAYYAKVLDIALDVYETTRKVPNLPMPESVGVQPTPGKGTPFKVKLLIWIGLRRLCMLISLLHNLTRAR